MSDSGSKDAYLSDETLEKNAFEKVVQENFADFYLFYEIFSQPVCRKMHPLLALYPWKPQVLRMFYK